MYIRARGVSVKRQAPEAARARDDATTRATHARTQRARRRRASVRRRTGTDDGLTDIDRRSHGVEHLDCTGLATCSAPTCM